MAISVKSNHLASSAAFNLSRASDSLKRSLERLSSGNRINGSGDDAGGLAVSMKLESKLTRNSEVRSSLNNTVSFLQVQEGALRAVGTILSRIAELKALSQDVTKNASDLENYDKEFRELQLELGQISRFKFNGVSLFSDQIPKNLFGDAIDLEVLKQWVDEDDSSQTTNVTRWGIRRFLSQNLEAGDKPPGGFGDDPPRDILSFVLSDEAKDGGEYNDFQTQAGLMQQDIDDWIQMIGERNIDGKIALIAVQKEGWGSSSAPDELLPKNGYIPPFASIYENYPRDEDSYNVPLPPSNQHAVSLGLSILKNAFLTETNNGQDLPAAMGLFIDNTGSVNEEEVDDAAEEFMDWVRNNYPTVAVSKRDDGISWNNGIYSASSERWIEQARLAVEDLLDNDPDVSKKIGPGTLDDDANGIKTLYDSIYGLADFDMSDLLDFQQRLSQALAQNGAESQAARFALSDLETKGLGMETAHGRIVDLDVAQESTRMARHNVLVQSSASLLVKANQLTEIALNLLE